MIDRWVKVYGSDKSLERAVLRVYVSTILTGGQEAGRQESASAILLGMN